MQSHERHCPCVDTAGTTKSQQLSRRGLNGAIEHGFREPLKSVAVESAARGAKSFSLNRLKHKIHCYPLGKN